ncbi:ABC transporter permease [Sungkyunkwania multivorans]|uniref:ABC transporter permease n=1 Tax=Sungkyunkwania multivorans TaxID=1173618 RepID=A0ABW3CSG7_9FLAO
MNFEFFIAKRIIGAKSYKSSISATIIKIAILAIALGLIMMLIAIATGLGLQNKIREKVAAFNGHIQISTYDNNNSQVSINPIARDQDFYPKFKDIEGIAHVQAIANKGGVIRTEETFEGIVLKGVGSDYDWNHMKEFLREGRLPNFSGKLNAEVMISSYMANRLLISVGDKVNAFFPKEDPEKLPNQLRLEVVGIYDSGFKDFDETYVFGDIRQVQRMNRWEEDQIGSFEVFLEDFDSLEEKGAEIYLKTLSTLDAQTISDKYYHIFEWVKLFDYNVAIIIAVMILVGGINMITALLVLILEKTQMIGILKAMGSSNASIRKIFLYNASYLIAIGLFWGNLIGLGAIWLQGKYNFLKFPNPEQYYVTDIPVHITIWHVLFLNVGVLFLCILMLLLPSYIISRIAPSKAIRFA